MRTGSLQVLSDASIGSGLDAAASALLDLTSVARGMKLPNMTETQRDAIATPIAGLTIYNTSTSQINYYEGSMWVAIASSPPVDFWRIHDADLNTFVQAATSAVDDSNQILAQIGDPSGYTANQMVFQFDTSGSFISGLDAAAASGNSGTSITLSPGDGDGGGNGGNFSITTGAGGASADGGNIVMTTSTGGANSGNVSITTGDGTARSGSITIQTGNCGTTDEVGGAITIQGGSCDVTGPTLPYPISIFGGDNSNSDPGSYGSVIQITAGSGANTGDVRINTQDNPGTYADGTSGDIVLTPGTNLSGDNGSIPGNSRVYGGATVGNSDGGYALVKGGNQIDSSGGDGGYAELAGGDNLPGSGDLYLGSFVRARSGTDGILIQGGTYIENTASSGTPGSVTILGGTGQASSTSVASSAGNVFIAGGGGGATFADDGGYISLAGGDGGSNDGWVQIGPLDNNSTTPSELRFVGGATATNYVGLIAPTTLANYTLILPQAAGTNGQFLQYTTGGQLAWASATSGGSYTATFVNGDLTAGVLTVTHSLNQTPVLVQVFDNNNMMITPDEVTLTTNNAANIDLTSFGTLTGTWSVIVHS